MFRFSPYITLLIVILPIVFGIGWNFFLALEGDAVLKVFRAPGFVKSVVLSLFIACASTALSFAFAQGVLILLIRWGFLDFLRGILAPLIALPHAALAVGFAFLIAPSGWLIRLFSPWATGFERPPSFITLNDELGFALILGLVIKELPYLLLMSLSGLSALPWRNWLKMGVALGHSPASAWFRLVMPQLFPALRLPLLVIFAFSLSVVDMALVLGPQSPPPLAVLALRWFGDSNLAMRPLGAGVGVLLFLIILACIALWLLSAKGLRQAIISWMVRKKGFPFSDYLLGILGLSILGGGCLTLIPLGLWSVARQWRFPDAWPAHFSLRTWVYNGSELLVLMNKTLLIAGLSLSIALSLTLLCLECERRYGFRKALSSYLPLIYLPLIVPQPSFLFGIQVMGFQTGLAGSLLFVVLGHTLFVLPYLYLSLLGPYRMLDPRYCQIAQNLGHSPNKQFIMIVLPLLLPAILLATAIGLAVSVALYLPTLLLGLGQWSSLTTEAVALASGGNRRILAVTAFLQAILPMLGFWFALFVPKWLYANQKGVLP